MAGKKRKSKASKTATLPEGFTPIGGFGVSWPGEDTKKGEMIRGIVTGYDEVIVTRNNKKTEVQNLKLEAGDGSIYTVWASAGNRALFDEDYTDVEVAIRYDGLGRKKRGQNPPRLFTIAADLE